MAGSIELHIDITSPFGYLAFHVLRHSPVFAGVPITYTPVLLGGILKAIGSAPPISVKNKREYLRKDRVRWARLFNVPMTEEMPPAFPFKTMEAQRALVAALELKSDLVPVVVERLFHLAWVEHKDVGDAGVYTPAFVEVFGEASAKEIFEMAKKDQVKQTLLKNGDRAIDSGCCGLPWFTVTKASGESDTFWGFDHLGQVADFLDLNSGQATGGTEAGWKAML